jgi:hypothetical protein
MRTRPADPTDSHHCTVCQCAPWIRRPLSPLGGTHHPSQMSAESSMAVQVAMALPRSTHVVAHWSRPRLICPTSYVSFLCRRKRRYPALTNMSTWRTVRLNPQLRFHARGMRSHSIDFGRPGSFSRLPLADSRVRASFRAASRGAHGGRGTPASATCEHRPWSLHWTSCAWQEV